MATSSEAVLSPVAGYFAWERPEGMVRFTEFTLTLAPPFRQTDVRYENPLCRLAARTFTGTAVCGQGCGMCGGEQPASHTCPFGMLMVQSAPSPGAAAARWAGRRFPHVDAMHEGLDRLCLEGIDEETILAHLPPNPIASAEEMRQAAAPKRGAKENAECGLEASPGLLTWNAEFQISDFKSQIDHDARTVAAPVDTKICDLLEYLEQVHRLVAGASRPEALCNRFLRAVAAVVPFSEMAIYLRGREAADWVIATVVEGGRVQGEPLAQPCRLEPGGLGAMAITQRQILMSRDGRIEPFNGRLEGPVTLAIPFPLAGGELSGVWLAMQGESPTPCALGGEVVRYMRLLAEFLGARLQQIEELATLGAPAAAPALTAMPAGPDPAMTLADALCAEAARGSRHNEPFALLCLNAHGRGTLPVGTLTREFTAILRPYDKVVGEECGIQNSESRIQNEGSGVPPFDGLSSTTWFIVLPYAHEAAARMIAGRLMTVFEDVLDAHGGAEELGARLSIGGSVWGDDAVNAEQMILNATGAADAAAAGEGSALHFTGEAVGNLH